MAGRRGTAPSVDYVGKIRRLEDELFFAREAIIHLVPPAAREVLIGHRRCQSREELLRWFPLAAETIVEMADAVPPPTCQGYPIDHARAKCPLCGQGPESPYYQGYALPEGLTRHLRGTHRSRQCDVFGAAEALARNRLLSDYLWRKS